jgi:hypothetical protein
MKSDLVYQAGSLVGCILGAGIIILIVVLFGG